MKKLIIQIPCYNEEQTLPLTLSQLPESLPGVDSVEWLVVDDGSGDGTVEKARKHGVHHIVRLTHNMGLAKSFLAGIDACLRLGADIIVNTDADNQYCADDIPKLIAPVLEGRADITIGTRPITQIEHFSFFKKTLQRFGSWMLSLVSQTDIPDAASGFRAISREAAMRLNVFSSYTYTLETIIQAKQKSLKIEAVSIRVNRATRPSRLVKSSIFYVRRSIATIIRIFVVYRPFRFFLTVGSTLFISGLLVGFRFLYYYAIGQGTGKVQSLILASALLAMGSQTVLIAFVADLQAVNRKLLEDIQYRIKRLEYGDEKESHMWY